MSPLNDSPERLAGSNDVPTHTSVYEALFSQCWNPGLCGMVWSRDSSLLRCPSQFLFAIGEWGTTHSAGSCCCHTMSSLPELPVSTPSTTGMNISSLMPSLLDFHTIWLAVSFGYIYFEISCDPSYDCARRQSVYLCLPLGRNSFSLFLSLTLLQMSLLSLLLLSS